MLQALPLVFVLGGLVLYAVLGGADFGAGFWQLFSGRGEQGVRIRAHAHHSMGPVWEANHVWLVFVLTVFWTGYPSAFGSIASTLGVPLFVAALGIVFRGAAYALRPGATSERESGLIDTIFAASSIVVPFMLGAAVGGIASNRVPVGNAAGHLLSSWLNPTSILIGVFAVANAAYLAAVYLAADAARAGETGLEGAFRVRALGTGVVAGGIAAAGFAVVHGDDPGLFHSLVHGSALAAVAVSALAGIATLLLVRARRYEPARYSAALAVAAVIAGWALARSPTILPGLSVHQAAAGHDTLVLLVISVLAGGAIVFPSLALLFGLTLLGRFRGAPQQTEAAATIAGRGSSLAALAWAAGGCLVAGVGLLTFASEPWEHATGLVFLGGFVLSGFLAITADALVRG